MFSAEQFVELEKDPIGRLDKEVPFAVKHVIVVGRVIWRCDVTERMGDKASTNYSTSNIKKNIK